jgi:GT2 family glycosyltransferase
MTVSLAIRNYNGEEYLSQLLSDAVKEDFHRIYILDDASTDSSKNIVERYKSAVWLTSRKNQGISGNSNKMLKHGDSEIVMFLDVDMELQSENIVPKIEEIFEDSEKSVVGGLVISRKNEPMWWNYGPEMHPVRSAKAKLVNDLILASWDDENHINYLRENYSDLTPNLEISFGEQKEREVDWVTDANFCIRREVFEEVKGFDENMQRNSVQDLCKRIREKGFKIFFSPTVKTKHLDMDTFGESRKEADRESKFYFYNKHWGMSREIFDKLYPQD